MAPSRLGFAERLGALWTELSLGPFVPQGDGTGLLEIEDRIVRLGTSADGESIVLTCSVGVLPRDERQRSVDTQRILRRSLGLMAQSRTGAMLSKGDASAPPTLILHASVPLAKATPAQLMALIEDIISRAMEYSRDISADTGAQTTAASTPASMASFEAETIIFRP